MQAWRWQGAGEPKAVLHLQTVTQPPLGPHDVLVANRVVAFNPVDWKLIGWGHSAWQEGHVPGVDGMGTIVALGSQVTHLRIGARVAYHTDLRHHGSFATHTIVPARALLTVPDALSDEAAAAMPCPGLTAWQALQKIPQVAGEAVLITGAASNVGRFAVQLALKAGARVFASASPIHHDGLKRLGVQAVADYHDANWLAQLQQANGNQRFYGVIDLVSSQQAESLLDSVGFYGHMVAVLGRVEQQRHPAFTRCISLHEIALGAQHAEGSDRQWQHLVRAGNQLLEQLVTGELQVPPLRIGAFAQLADLLQTFKDQGQGTKFLVKLS